MIKTRLHVKRKRIQRIQAYASTGKHAAFQRKKLGNVKYRSISSMF